MAITDMTDEQKLADLARLIELLGKTLNPSITTDELNAIGAEVDAMMASYHNASSTLH